MASNQKRIVPTRWTIIAGILLVLTSWSVFVFSDNKSVVIERIGEGYIDWTNGFIYASGEAALDVNNTNRAWARVQAERAATVIAQRNLLEIFQGVRVESNTTIKDFLLKNDRIRATVQGIVYGSRPVKTLEEASGSVKVIISAPIWGNLARDLLEAIHSQSDRSDRKIRSGNLGRRLADWVFQALLFIREEILGLSAQAASTTKNTGLIIDVTNTDIKPGLFPRIYDQDGNQILGPENVNIEIAAREGMIGYSGSVESAKEDLKRVGVLPLVTRGTVPLSSNSGIDIQIKDLSLKQIKEALESPAVLANCRVMVAYKITF